MLQKLERLLQTEIDPVFAKRAKFIFGAIEKKRPRKILDVGCGRGFYVQTVSLYDFPQEIHGVDINGNYLEQARKICLDKRVKIRQGDIYHLPYPDNFFDLVICSEILEHLSNDKEALLEVKRVLKPRGTLLITVPNTHFPFLWDPLNWLLMRVFGTHVSKDIWWLAGIWADHERLYTKQALQNVVRSVFSIEDTKLFIRNCWPFSHFILYGIGKNLVERAGVTMVSRFNFKDEKRLARLMARIFELPSHLLDKRKEGMISANIGIQAKKQA